MQSQKTAVQKRTVSSNVIISHHANGCAETSNSFRKAIQPVSCQQGLPFFSGKPNEWLMFYSVYNKSMHTFSEEGNLNRIRNFLKEDAFRVIKLLFVSNQNFHTVMKTLLIRHGQLEFILESMMKKSCMLHPV